MRALSEYGIFPSTRFNRKQAGERYEPSFLTKRLNMTSNFNGFLKQAALTRSD